MKPLGTNLEALRDDFESVRGKPFKHYFCPILHVDENVQLSKGHVVPKSMGGVSRVLQRKDVDNNFGSFFEAEAADFITLDPNDALLGGNPETMRRVARRFKPQILADGMDKPIDGTYRKVGDDIHIVVSLDDLGIDPDNVPKTIVAKRIHSFDARSSVLATALRTSHLCWFQKLGYRYVFSNEGLLVAHILRLFYREFIEPRYGEGKTKSGSLISEEVKREVNDLCLQFANLCRPLPKSVVETFPDELRRGTPDSGWFMALWDGNQIYGRISLVRLADHYIRVMTPMITDARGWAMIDLAVNLELEWSFAKWDSDMGRFEVGPPSGNKLIWPSSMEETQHTLPLNIREAAQLAIGSGRMPQD